MFHTQTQITKVCHNLVFLRKKIGYESCFCKYASGEQNEHTITNLDIKEGMACSLPPKIHKVLWVKPLSTSYKHSLIIISCTPHAPPFSFLLHLTPWQTTSIGKVQFYSSLRKEVTPLRYKGILLRTPFTLLNRITTLLGTPSGSVWYLIASLCKTASCEYPTEKMKFIQTYSILSFSMNNWEFLSYPVENLTSHIIFHWIAFSFHYSTHSLWHCDKLNCFLYFTKILW